MLDPTRDNYDFVGWDPSETISVAENTSVTATWTPTQYTITYVLDGGDNNVANPTTFDVEDLDVVLQSASKADHTFDGWTTDVAGSETITTITVAANITVYAQFTLIE